MESAARIAKNRHLWKLFDHGKNIKYIHSRHIKRLAQLEATVDGKIEQPDIKLTKVL